MITVLEVVASVPNPFRTTVADNASTLAAAFAPGLMPIADVMRRIGRSVSGRTVGTQVLVFLLIGVLSTLVHLGLFAGLRGSGSLSGQVANVVALLTATLANTAANRRWTFGVRGRTGRLRHQAQGLVVFALTLAMTSSALAVLSMVAPSAPTRVETVVVAVATVASTVVKFVLMRVWIFSQTLPQPLLQASADPDVTQPDAAPPDTSADPCATDSTDPAGAHPRLPV